MLSKDSELRKVYGINKEQELCICKFLQGCVYCWCNISTDEWFSLRDLMGGENYYWEGTPLYCLYEKHQDKETAVKDAGKDAGWLLKKVLEEDPRKFDTKVEGLVRKYKWID